MKNMNPRVKVLKQLVADGHYVVDEAAVAEAVVLRATARRAIPDVTFRCAPKGAPQVRSFHPRSAARPFRLTPSQGRPLHARTDAAEPPA